MVESTTSRTRDPARRDRILLAAAELVSHRGYHQVGMSEIGAAAGIGASGIYRHFENKASVLVALFDRVIDSLLAEAMVIDGEAPDPDTKLAMLIAQHLDAALRDRELFVIYLRESQNLAESDRKRLQHKQRRYVDEWVSAFTQVRPNLSDAEARTVIQSIIGGIQSLLRYDGGLPTSRLRTILIATACAALRAPLD